VKGSAPAFVDAKLRERDTRVRRAGESRYLVEPNVKDGKGGLRDLNTLSWVARYVYGTGNPDDLVTHGLFTPAEAGLFKRCEAFLWRVRCHLHFETGRAEERLTFENQRVVSARMGFKERGAEQAVERFMKAYFRTAKDVGDLTAIVCAGLEARHAKPRPVLDRMLRSLRRRRTQLESDDFVVDNDRINVRDDQAFARDPVNLVRMFWLADRHNMPIHPDATRLASRSMNLIGPRLRRDPEANGSSWRSSQSQNAPGGGAASHERDRHTRPLHPRLRARRGDDAVQHVSSLHRRRAPQSARSGCSPKSIRDGRRASTLSRTPSFTRSATGGRCSWRSFFTTSPRAAGKITRLRER
jgi:[protein-PII] uridylyltransferase